MGNLSFQRRTSDLEKDNDDNLNKIENLPCQTEISSFDFENSQHPLLVNTVLKKIFKYSCIADLKKSRLVSKDWNFEAYLLLKKIEWKSPILFQTIGHLNSFVKTFGPCPQNIPNQNLDFGQILVPSDGEPEIIFHTILPIMNSITGLKVNINIQRKRTFVTHEAFQHLAQTLQTFDVRFIKNDGIFLTPDKVYPRTQLPFLPALTTAIIRMDGITKYERIVHHEYVRHGCFRPEADCFKIFNSEYKMCVELIQEFVAKSPLLFEIHLIMSNCEIISGFIDDSYEHKSIRILTNLKPNELEKITHLRFAVSEIEDIQILLELAKRGLNRLKYLSIDFVVLMGGLNPRDEKNLLETLKCQKETLEYFKLNSTLDYSGVIQFPSLLPKLKFLKLSGHIIYEINSLDLNKRFPNLIEIDFTGGRSFFLSQFRVSGNGGPSIIPCAHVKKLQLDNKSFQVFGDTDKRLSQYFPNVTQVKYHMDDGDDFDEHGQLALWTMTSLEHLVLKVPLCSIRNIYSAVINPFHFMSGGMGEQEINRIQDSVDLLARSPNITWLTELKSLKIKQKRRYGFPEVQYKFMGRRNVFIIHLRNLIESLGCSLLSNMRNLEQFSSDFHCFSEESIAQLKMKISHFEPGTCINQSPLFH